MRTRRIACISMMTMTLAVLLLPCVSFAESFQYVSIDVTGSTGTLATGISPRGTIVGIYFDSSGTEHGFVLKDSNFSTVDVPGYLVGVSGILETEVNGINAAGDIVGDYFAPPGAPGAPECKAAYSPPCTRGFLYSHGQFSNVLVPGHPGSFPNSITPEGDIYGAYFDSDFMVSRFGFARLRGDAERGDGDVRSEQGFTYISLAAGGGELKDPAQSVPTSINTSATPNGSIIVGTYIDLSTNHAHGYIVHNGIFNSYDVPSSLRTRIWGINPERDFVGDFRDTNHNTHGFLQRWGESMPVTIDVPSEAPFNSTFTNAFGINPAGAIVGVYIDSSGNYHGFLAVKVENH
jgi:hypothetical protein